MSLTKAQLDQIAATASTYTEPAVALTQRICAVPAPTGAERQRAELVTELWRERGYTTEIDDVGNVYVRRGQKGQGPVLMLLAHMDTVFPGTTPLTIQRDGDIVRGPGIGDNSLGVASMLTAIEILDQLGWQTDADIVAVADVGEEGLGDLRGARAAIKRYQDTLGAVIAVDGRFGYIVNAAVGSKRLKLTVQGPGGHSFGSFGTPSAIHGLGKVIAALTELQVPKQPKTTFNVGMIEGGTSINSIAASATALLDLRSTDANALNQLVEEAEKCILQNVGPGLKVAIEVMGERPAGERQLNDPLIRLAAETLRWLDVAPQYTASSTDANIPISLDIPAVCIGITHGSQAHTTEEYMHVEPISKGLAQLVRLCVDASRLICTE